MLYITLWKEDDIMAEELPSYKTELISIENLEKDYYEIKIKKPNDMNWVAGQYMRLGLPTKEITEKKKLRALSFASLPEDDVILLSTRTGKEISNFKQNLLTVQPGEEVEVKGPLGQFTLPEDGNQALVFFAGGVGVTPIRALLEKLAKDKSERTIKFVYSSLDYYFYKEDFAEFKKSLPNAEFIFVRDENDVDRELTKLTSELANDALYYVSSSEKIVEAVSQSLQDKGIDAENIKHDILYGY